MMSNNQHPAQDELLPCPFCGNALEVAKRRYNPHARCVTENCKGAQLPLLNIDQPDDVARWNTRPAQDEREAVERFSPTTSVPHCGRASEVEAYMTEDDDGEYMTVSQHERIVAALTRPTQTAPQPAGVVLPPQCTDKSKPVKYRKGWNSCLSEVFRLNRAQTEQQPYAWATEREGDPTFPRLHKDEHQADHWVQVCNVAPPIIKRPLYAAPIAQTAQRGETK